MNIQQTFSSGTIWEPLYQWHTSAHPVEVELFQSQPVRRLKYLHHFGASALFSPITHSRFDHTVGVWSLAAHFFPEHHMLRIAAILHDIGHLPFSHALEQTLGYSHRMHTEKWIQSGTVAEILTKHGIAPSLVVEFLKSDSPLTNKSPIMGLDHLDSFLRDTYYAGKHELPPSDLVKRLRFHGHFLESDEETALKLIHAVVEDHRLMLQPAFLAMDSLLAKAVIHHCAAHPDTLSRIPSLLDHELIQELLQSNSAAAKEIINVLMYEPHRIQTMQEPVPESIQVKIGKLYKKQPLINKKLASEASFNAAVKLSELDELTGVYFFTIR